MRCPKCHSVDDKVIDSRASRDGAEIRRRRYTTYEKVEITELTVIKRNGSREPFDREKVLRGLKKACEKRPVSHAELETAADDIAAGFEADEAREVPTKLVGLKVMEQLHTIDSVAYVRYASVYRQFQDVGEFLEEIYSMERRVPRTRQQLELFNS
jgi:transcriptional repressor NrdR